MRRRKGGFTLIELLVVVSIVALLIAILLPSLTQAREAAKRGACLSQLSQTQLAAILYSDDHDGLLPDVHEANVVRSDNSKLGRFYPLQGYIGSPQNFDCPSAVGPPYGWPDTRISYFFTGQGSDAPWGFVMGTRQSKPRAVHSIPRPASVVSVGDTRTPNSQKSGGGYHDYVDVPLSFFSGSYLVPRHGGSSGQDDQWWLGVDYEGMMNFAFMDRHAASYSMQARFNGLSGLVLGVYVPGWEDWPEYNISMRYDYSGP
jgi:prepilin-type N-terminal cleavage/methylation domain-containing protein